MQWNCKFILTAPPDATERAKVYGHPVGHIAYRLAQKNQLLQSELPAAVQGGFLVVGAQNLTGSMDPMACANALLQECNKRKFDGIILDFEGEFHPILADIVARLGAMPHMTHNRLYLPESYAKHSARGTVMISSALSGGSLVSRLQEAVAHHGRERVCLAVERVREDFFLPAPTGSGRPITEEELQTKRQRYAATTFFSKELCARYFTYMSPDTGAHFILFDTAETIRQKIQVAQGLGISTVLLAYPQVDDLLGEIFPPPNDQN